MDMKQMEYFILAYEHGSFSKAAEKAFITQQGISNSIVTLEKELGVSLFKRTPQGLIPTNDGTEFYYFALSSYSSWKRMYTRLTEHTPKDVLRVGFDIGIMEIASPEFFMNYLKKIRPEQIIYRNYTDQCKQELLRGNIDIGFCDQPVDRSQFTSLFTKQRKLCLLVSKENGLAEKATVSVSDLAGQNLIDISTSTPIQAYYKSVCLQHNIIPNVLLNASQGAMMVDFVANNAGVAFYAGEAQWVPDRCVIKYFSDIDISYGYDVIIKKDAKLNDLMQEFIDEYIAYEEKES